jgi:LysM repeat protein
MWLVFVCSGIILVGCRADSLAGDLADSTQTAEITPTVALTLFKTPVPSLTPSPLPTPEEIPITPAPTPTPFSHTIVEGDTLGAISLRYGIPQEDIMAANPGIDPRLLIVGEALIIPLEGNDYQVFMTPTPIPLVIHPPNCYFGADDVAWCFMLVENNRPHALESLSGWIGFSLPNGVSLAGQTALPPLNLLLPGEALPLSAQFSGPLPGGLTIQGGLLSALPVSEDGWRYLRADVTGLVVDIHPEGRQARISGEVVLDQGQGLPTRVWAVAIAFNHVGEVVGLRKLEVGDQCLESRMDEPAEDEGDQGEVVPTQIAALPEGCLAFNLVVYSAGPEIERVDLLVEIRP